MTATSPGHPAAPFAPSATGARPPAVPLRPLGVGELLDGAVRCFRNNFRACVTIAFPIAVVRVAAVALFLFGTVTDNDFAFAQLMGQAFVSALFGTTLAGLLAPVFSGELVGRRVSAPAASATTSSGSTRQPT